MAEATLAFWATMIRRTSGVPLSEVWLAHQRHRAWTPSRQAHFDAKLRFRRPFNAIVLSADALTAPLASARAELAVHLATLAQRVDAELVPPSETVCAQLARRVAHDLRLGALAPLPRVARALGTSTRTLQRELQREGRTYRDVVEAARRELAPALLGDATLKVEAVAAQLGYSDARAFRRACVRWFGKTPRAR